MAPQEELKLNVINWKDNSKQIKKWINGTKIKLWIKIIAMWKFTIGKWVLLKKYKS